MCSQNPFFIPRHLQVCFLRLCCWVICTGCVCLRSDGAIHLFTQDVLFKYMFLYCTERLCRLGRSVQCTVQRTYCTFSVLLPTPLIPQPHTAFLLLLRRRKDCSRPKKGETPAQAAERRLLAVSSLQALALDYDLGDHEILKESILLEVRCDV